MSLSLCAPRMGDHVLVSDGLYGGTYRLFSDIYTQYGLEFDYVNLTDADVSARADARLDSEADARQAGNR